MRRKTQSILLCLIILIGIVLRAIVLLNTDTLDRNDVTEIVHSYRLALGPFNPLAFLLMGNGSTSQVAHYFLMSLFMRFIDEPVVVSRMISFVFGILVIVPYYMLIKLAFSQEIALASVLALAFYSTHVQISTAPYPLAAVSLFAILAAYFLIQYIYKNDSKTNKVYFASSIISTILATSFRADAWLLPFIFSFLLLLGKRLKEALIFLVFSSLYILTSFYVWHRYSNVDILNTLEIRPHNLLPAFSNYKALYGNYHIFTYVKILFDRFSVPLSMLGFLGMPNTLKNKRQHVFLITFWGLLAMVTLYFNFTARTPLQRYSYIFAIFFIPFIFLGINRIVLNICRIFYWNDFYKRVLLISLSVIASLYFIFFSLNILVKEMPEMKYSSLAYNLSDWMKKNVNSGDIIITPFGNEFWFATISNKFIGNPSRLYDILSSDKEYKEYRLNKKIIDEIVAFSNSIVGPAKEDRPFTMLLIKRGQPQEARRIVLILDERAYTLLRDNFPILLKEIDIKYDGIFYTCVLPLYDP